MSTLNALNTLIGIVNSRKNKLNPTGPMRSAAVSSDPNQTNPTAPVDAATSPANANPAVNPSPSDPGGAQNPVLLQPTGAPSPSPMAPAQNSPQTEDSLRQQLQQSDVYDLSGEKAAAEALTRDDAFKQQAIEQKAEQTKDFFAEQDRKQQETCQDLQKQAGQQLQEQQEKEFWDQKKSQEMQAGMDKELESLHQAAKQEHQEWRNDFTQGICRDDVAALYNKDITERVGQYKERLDDLGTNPVDAVQTIDKYKVKLQDEAAPQIEQKTAELHQEHFPEYSAQNNIDGHGPDGHVPDRSPEQSIDAKLGEAKPGEAQPAESHSEEEGGKVGKTGPGITFPDGGPRADMPGLGGRESIRKGPAVPQEAQGADNDGGSGSGDSAKGSGDNNSAEDSAYYAGRLRQQADDAAAKSAEERWEASVKSTTENVEMAEHLADHFGGEAVARASEHLPHAAEQVANSVPEHLGMGGAIPGEVWEGAVAQAKFMYEAGPEGLKAGVQYNMDKARDAFDQAKESVQQGWQATKEKAAEFSDKAQDVATTVKDNLTVSSNEKIEQMAQDSNKGGESADNKLLGEIQAQDKGPTLGDSKFLAGTGDAQPAPPEKGFDQSQFARDIDKSQFTTPAMNADLASLYAERWKDLHPDSSAAETSKVVNDFSAKAQQIDQQTHGAEPQGPAPAPQVKTVGPDDLPTAWGGGNAGVVGRVERLAPTETSARTALDPAEPAQSPALPAPAPEVQASAPPPPPTPSPAPAPQQPAPSMGPSL